MLKEINPSTYHTASDGTQVIQLDRPAFYSDPIYRIDEVVLIQANYPELRHADFYLWFKADPSRMTPHMVAGFRIRPKQTADTIILSALRA